MKQKHCQKILKQKHVEYITEQNNKLRKIFQLSALTLNIRFAIQNMGKRK